MVTMGPTRVEHWLGHADAAVRRAAGFEHGQGNAERGKVERSRCQRRAVPRMSLRHSR